MVMTTQIKSAIRLFKKHIARFITVVAIVLVSVGFSSGVGELEYKIRKSSDKAYRQHNIADIYIKSKDAYGFSAEEIQKIEALFKTDEIEKSLCYELESEEGVIRAHTLNVKDKKVNKLQLLEGEYPTQPNEILVERDTSGFKKYNVGDSITLQGQEYTVCGVVYNAWYIYDQDEPSFAFEDKTLKNVVYLHTDALMLVNDISISLVNREAELFDGEYEEKIEGLVAQIEQLLGTDRVSVLSLYENIGVYTLVAYAEKVGLISIIFVVFFLLVTLLVVYSTMARLFEEERGQIACQKTLGYTDNKIVGKYVAFVLVAAILGGILAFPVALALTYMLYNGFNLQYKMPAFPADAHVVYYVSACLLIILATGILTYLNGKKAAGQKPATLLTPKAPKAGKKVILEKIPLLWNALSFKYKSTLRNVLLFKSRFLMTVVSVMGATVLVFAGLGLMDCILVAEGAVSLVSIAVTMVVFSAALCALVIYNLTNINVSERNREIATLMVLGYQDREVTGYIFREIYIMSFIGAVLGIPLGIAFVDFVFNFIDFGRLADIKVWTYLITPCLTMAFSFISTLLLRKKITSTDMNASLKTLE